MSAAVLHEPLTRSVEDYLKAIYRLSLRGRAATNGDIAELLELSAPSVTGMVKRLSEQGLLEHEAYKGVQLTAEGRRLALRMVRRHRILEAYLVAFLGYGWERVHEEAERLEHAVSDQLIEQMARALGNPKFDPHGDPIPEADGTIPELVCTPLADIPAGETVEIRQADTRHPDRLRYIASLGLIPGARVLVIDRQPFQGPITIEVEGIRRVLGDEIARLLLCTGPEVAA